VRLERVKTQYQYLFVHHLLVSVGSESREVQNQGSEPVASHQNKQYPQWREYSEV